MSCSHSLSSRTANRSTDAMARSKFSSCSAWPRSCFANHYLEIRFAVRPSVRAIVIVAKTLPRMNQLRRICHGAARSFASFACMITASAPNYPSRGCRWGRSLPIGSVLGNPYLPSNSTCFSWFNYPRREDSIFDVAARRFRPNDSIGPARDAHNGSR